MERLTKDDKALVARGYAVTANEEAFHRQAMEASLQGENFRYERAILDLNSELGNFS